MVRCIVYLSAVPYNYSLQSCAVNSWCWNHIVLCTSCFDGCNKAVGALYIGVVGGLAAAHLTLEAGHVVAGSGGEPSPFVRLVGFVRLHSTHATCIAVACE